MKQIVNLHWKPRWVSHLGCVKGCLDHLGLGISDGWLYGGTGHAFVLNIHERVCPSGPTAWRTEVLYKLGRNLGYRIEGVHGCPEPDALEGVQRLAWDFVRRAIDQGRPCFGWELAVPEYYGIHGYDETGYYYSGPGCNAGGPKPWREMGRSEIRIVEVCSVEPGEPAVDTEVVRAALRFAIGYAEEPGKWTFPRYTGGPEGYATWIRAIRAGTALQIGMAYNAAVWAECRKHAAGFLREAGGRLEGNAGRVLQESAERYETVASHLDRVSGLFPFSPELTQNPVEPDARLSEACDALEKTRESELDGLERLREALALVGG
jgi:hypothetical protein